MLVDMSWCVERMVWTEVWLYWCEVNGTPSTFFWVTRVTPLDFGNQVNLGGRFKIDAECETRSRDKGGKGAVFSLALPLPSTIQGRIEEDSRVGTETTTTIKIP
jgi:hypothetical protein